MRRLRISLALLAAAALITLALGTAVVAGLIQQPALRALTARVIGENFGEVRPGILRTGKSLPLATRWLQQMYGVRTVLHLAWKGNASDLEEAALLESAGVGYHRFSWRPDAAPDPAELERALALVAEAPRPLLIHCIGGTDRTGGLVGLLKLRDGASLAEVERDWSRHGAPSAGWQSALRSAAERSALR